jgi:hypothetical protein
VGGGEQQQHQQQQQQQQQQRRRRWPLHYSLKYEFTSREAGYVYVRPDLSEEVSHESRATIKVGGSGCDDPGGVGGSGGGGGGGGLSRPSPAAPSPHRLRVFSAPAWTFHQLGVLSASQPFSRIPPRFYELPPPSPLPPMARPFDLLEELRSTPVDELPSVLLVDIQADTALLERLHEARALLAPQPLEARPALLALLVSSWLGGHWSRAEGDERNGLLAEESLDDRRWRQVAGTNVRPLGTVRRSGCRARALLYKVLFDEVLLPLGGKQSGQCELRRSRTGRLECRVVHTERAVDPATEIYTGGAGRLVELYA